MTHGGLAKSERERKERNPEKFCPNPKCLWRASSGPCPKHQKLTLGGPDVLSVR